MAKIIVFPRLHQDYQYNMDKCALCKADLKENDMLIEITDPIERTVEYLCSSCNNKPLNFSNQKMAICINEYSN